MITTRYFIFLNLAIALLFFSACEQKEGRGGKDEVVLNQRIRSKVQTLDPADVGDTASSGVCREFFECLYAYHYLKRPHEIVPQLAASLPQTSEDGLV